MTQPLQKTADERISDLMKIHPKGFDLSLDRIKSLLAKLGNPQDKIPPVIHFAGTNGKGSAIAFTRAILESAGLSVHVHTSPHLVNWHERYRLGQKLGGGRLVDDATLSAAIKKVADANEGQPITVFEVLTAVTFVLFSENDADVCLIEVGLGGRFDATNVMEETDVTVITPVSLDHEAYLGDTLAKIAFEKAGIIKQKTDLVVGPQSDDALEVIEKQAAKNLAPLHRYGQEFQASIEHGRLAYQADDALFDVAIPALPGAHQIQNAATAITAARAFCSKHAIELTNTQIDNGIQAAYWPGRMQRLSKGKLVEVLSNKSTLWLDGGHNPDAGKMISHHFQQSGSLATHPLIMVCGMLDTKDASGYLSNFADLASQIITVPILSSDAGIPAEQLAQEAKGLGMNATHASSLEAAIDSLTMQEATILICGSLYLVGDALKLNGTPPE